MKELLNPQESKQKWVAFIGGALIGVGICLASLTRFELQSKMLSLQEFSLNYWVAMGIAFVMMAAAFQWMKRKTHPLFDSKMHVPLGKDIDKKLLLGSALVGAGFALTGFTPALAIAAAGAGIKEGIVFFIAMSVGMSIFFFYKENLENQDED